MEDLEVRKSVGENKRGWRRQRDKSLLRLPEDSLLVSQVK